MIYRGVSMSSAGGKEKPRALRPGPAWLSIDTIEATGRPTPQRRARCRRLLAARERNARTRPIQSPYIATAAGKKREHRHTGK